ncbi:MAG TPA: fibronectin type III domain-containing protein, partial [Methanomassiliicoccales archaeon]|nr:fibronectin type III domain-containing protein [Methanomassiliicoccales archaeon]
YLDARARGYLPMFFLGWNVDYPDPDDFANPFCHVMGAFPLFIGLYNFTLSDLVDQAARELNTTIRAELYSQIQWSCYENAYYLWTSQPTNFYVEQDWVNGFVYNPTYPDLPGKFYDLSLNVSVPSEPIWTNAFFDSGHANLSWNAPETPGTVPAIGYFVYRGTSPSDLAFYSATVFSTNFTDPEIMPAGQTWYYAVRAMTPVGDGALSDVTSLTAPDTPPDAPTIGSAEPTLSSVVVHWSAPVPNGGSNVTFYAVYYGTSAHPSTVNVTAPANATSLEITGLDPGTKYYFNVVAVNAAGIGPHSEDVNATTLNVAPDAPTIGTATPTLSSMTVHWTVPAPNGGTAVTGCKVFYGTTAHPSTVNVSAAADATSVEVTGLKPGTTYFFNVVAINAFGASVPSADVSVSTLNIAPNAPTIGAITVLDTKLKVAWSAPVANGGTNVTGYNVYRGDASGGETLFTTIGNVTSYNDTSVAIGHKYFYKVCAINAAGNGTRSAEVNATAMTVPSAPIGLNVTVGDRSMFLNWTASHRDGATPITNYSVYRGTTASGEILLVKIGNRLNFTDDGVQVGQTYFYEVRAVNVIGSGPLSNERSAMAATCPTAPRNVTGSATGTSATLSWLEPSDNGSSSITVYRIYRANSSEGPYTLIATSTTPSYADTGLKSGASYSYKVVAVNAIGNSVESTVMTVAVPPDNTLLYVGIIGIIAVIGIVATVLVVRKRK